MPRGKNEKEIQARRMYQSGCKLVEIARELDVPAGTVRRWKSVYDWDNDRADHAANAQNKANVRNAPLPEVESVMKNPELSDKQRLFCLYYSKSFNATKSYQKAYGCSYDAARANGPELLAKTCVRDEITRLKKMRYGQALLEPEDIFQKYMDIAFADITDYVEFGKEEVPVVTMYGPVMVENPETGEKEQLTKIVNAIHALESSDVDGTIIAEVSQGKDGFKIKLMDRMKALQWLSDHMDMATEEQKAKLENIRANTAKLAQDDKQWEKIEIVDDM